MKSRKKVRSYGSNHRLGLGFVIEVNDVVINVGTRAGKPAAVKHTVLLSVRLANNQELLKRRQIAEAFQIFVCINQIAVNSVSPGRQKKVITHLMDLSLVAYLM